MKYEILGEPLPVVVCHLEGGESMITERGSMVWMSPNMKMETGAGGIGKAFGRMFSGDSIFQNTYTAQGGPGMIAFASTFPGSIRAVQIDPSHPIAVQKSAFLASEAGVELSVTRGRSSLPSTTGATYRRRTMSFSSPHKSSGLNTTAAKSSSEPWMGWAAWSSPLLKNTISPARASKYSLPQRTRTVPRSTLKSSISSCQWHSSSSQWAG